MPDVVKFIGVLSGMNARPTELIGQFQQQAVSVAVLSVFVGIAQRVDDEAAAILHGIDGLVCVLRNPAVKARQVNLVDEIEV